MIKQLSNKLMIIVTIIVTVGSLGNVLTPKKVEAALPTTGPWCFNYYDVGYYEYTACPTGDGTVNKPDYCYKKNASGGGGWTALQCGTVIQTNSACVNNSCKAGATRDGTPDGSSESKNPQTNGSNPIKITNPSRDAVKSKCNNTNTCLANNPLINWIKIAINFLSVGVGVIVVIMIIIGGIQYASAGPNPQAVQAAKKRITNSLIALLAYFFVFAFMQWLVPGGIF